MSSRGAGGMLSRSLRGVPILLILSAAGPSTERGPAAAGSVVFVVDGASSSLLLSGGGTQPIVAQSINLGPAPGIDTFALVDHLILPEVEFAFGQIIAIVHEHPTTAQLDPTTGAIEIATTLKITDDGGTSVELPVTLTTGESTGVCEDGSNIFCIPGFPGNEPFCEGDDWNDSTGSVRLVAFVVVPIGSGSQIEGSCIVIEIVGTITPGDSDMDSQPDIADNCPDDVNATQTDGDGDGVGDLCDNCLATPNTAQGDFDGDAIGDLCDPFGVNFQPCGAPLPAGFVLDCGQPYDPVLGYGWDGLSALACRDRGVDPDQSLDTFCFSTGLRHFEIDLEPGDYDVTVEAGDAAFVQGPQRVLVEGLGLIQDVITPVGFHATGSGRVYVRDGRLTVDIGGGGGTTTLNTLTIAWVSESDQPDQLYAWNYQPETSPVPQGYARATGAVDTELTRWGWDALVETRDRQPGNYSVFDTFAFALSQTFEAEVLNRCYVIEACAGDAWFSQGPQVVSVEGQAVVNAGITGPGEFACGVYPVSVTDGRLTVSIGDGTGNTTINYLTAATTPVDLDLDGFTNCLDNCQVTANPDQTDTDMDLLGDVCDPDDDNDGVEDEDDCRPLLFGSFALPEEVFDVTIIGAAPATVLWPSQAGIAGSATEYNLVTGSLLNLLATRNFGGATCVTGLVESIFSDPTIPAVGDGTYYLIAAQNDCGSGGYGASGQIPDPRVTISCP